MLAQERHGWHRLQPAVIGMSGLWAPTGWTCRDQDGAPRRFGPRGCLTWWCELPHDVSSGGADLSRLLVPDGLSELGVPLLPSFNSRPQGGGTALLDEQAGFTAMVYVPTSGGAWPPLLEPSGRSPRDGAPQGPRRRCGAQCTGRSWTNSAPRLSSTGRTRSSTPPWCGRKRTFADRPNPVGRGKQGSGLHRLGRASGHPAQRCHDRRQHAREPRPQAAGPRHTRHPLPTRPRRRRLVKLRADEAHFSAEHLAWPERVVVPRIARPGIESGERRSRHRWKTERSIARLFSYRRLTIRYERKGTHFHALLGWATDLTS